MLEEIQNQSNVIIQNNVEVIHDTGSDLSDSYAEEEHPYHKLTYTNLELILDKQYNDINHKYSSALDILASYLKGHKIIYMESKYYCDQQLNALMMPSIFLSTAATVLSSIIKDYYWGAYLIAGVNGLIAFLLAIVNYLKLDAASEAHKISSHQSVYMMAMPSINMNKSFFSLFIISLVFSKKLPTSVFNFK
jgi:hypothetical protein